MVCVDHNFSHLSINQLQSIEQMIEIWGQKKSWQNYFHSIWIIHHQKFFFFKLIDSNEKRYFSNLVSQINMIDQINQLFKYRNKLFFCLKKKNLNQIMKTNYQITMVWKEMKKNYSWCNLFRIDRQKYKVKIINRYTDTHTQKKTVRFVRKCAIILPHMVI